MKLSVLDLSPIASGSTPGEALWRSVDLARHTEALGFVRTWFAEHHNAGGLACSAPEILIGQAAAATSTMRVGAGGIMLPNHPPLKVAEVFRVLSALFPGRVDLGLGRAPGTDGRTAAALRGARIADDFPNQVAELARYIGDDGGARPGFATTIRAIPAGVAAPDVWIVGSSASSGAFAARKDLGFAFAHHIAPDDAVAALQGYRAEAAAPRSILAVSAAVAATAREADDLVACARVGSLRFSRGLRDLPMPSVDEARAHVWDEEDLALAEMHEGRQFVGWIDDVAPRLRALMTASGADELMVMTNVHDHAARKRSYALLRDALCTMGA